jgi:hypothetical protein
MNTTIPVHVQPGFILALLRQKSSIPARAHDQFKLPDAAVRPNQRAAPAPCAFSRLDALAPPIPAQGDVRRA